MIKYFRKIRQELLSDSKFRKYLIYAIGEIFLVVIGILIALQINNWNENRKVNNLKEQVFKQIYIDVVNDSINLSETINYLDEKKVILRKILHDSIPAIAYDTITRDNQTEASISILLITNSKNMIHIKKKGISFLKHLVKLKLVKIHCPLT